VARAVVLISDLLFASRVQASLQAAGHEVELVASRKALEGGDDRLARCDVLVVDLTDEALGGVEVVEEVVSAKRRREPEVSAEPPSGETAAATRLRTLGFYSHVDVETRERAQRAGFDLVVPRSRMAREGGELVSRLAASAG
jgi:DNA-binding NarL/FixJ family response regulator